MARNNFTFQTALKLNSSNFKKGVKDVQKSITSLKNSFLSLAGALGAGLGFTKLISDVKNTAVQLSVAKNVLENVSNVTKEYTDGVRKGTIQISNYADNLAYVRRLAKDYSQDLVSLTENFAQFHAACEKTNLDLEQQKDVFEALTRAAAFYHMSADRSRDMMTAITQMMSKGKVAAEELRRQLGNSLPGAFNLMAAALGVTTAQLEDMMKKGQVISSEALPKFAAMLNTVTKNADFDSLQMSLNRLKNTWYEFVEGTGAENMFKGLIDWADRFLATITRNFTTIMDAAKGLVAGILSLKLFSYLQKQSNAYFTNLEAQYEKSVKAYEASAKKILDTNENFKIHHSTKDDELRARVAPISDKDREILIKYTDDLLELSKIKNELGKENNIGGTFLSQKDIENLAKLNSELKRTRGETIKIGTTWSKVGKTITGAFKNIAMQVEGILMSMGAMAVVSAIIAGLTAIFSHLKRIREEWEKINNIHSDYLKEVQKADSSSAQQEKILRSNLSILQDTNKSERQRLAALKEINKQMGTTYNKDALDKTKQAYKDIVKEVNRWVEATKLQAKIQVQARKGAEAEALIQEKQANIIANKAKLNNFKWWDQQGREHQGVDPNSWSDRVEYNKIKREIDMDRAAIFELKKVTVDADQALKNLGVSLYDIYSESGGGASEGGGGAAEGISKVFDKYNKDLKELENKLREHAITQEEYNEEFDELVTKFWKEAAASGEMSIDKIIDKMDKGKTLTKMEQWYKDLFDAAQKAAFNNTLRAAQAAIDKALDDSIAAADKALDDKMDEWADKAERTAQANLDALFTNKPGRTDRDSTFDYKKSKSDVQGEELDVSNDYIRELEDAIETIISKYDKLEDASEAVKQKLEEWRVELSRAKAEAATLEEAMKISKIQEDIDEFKKAIGEAVYGGVRNLASSLDRCVKGVDSLKETFEDTDASGWEKFMAIFNEIVQVIETIMSAYQTLQAIQDVTAKMHEAEIALVSTKIALLQKELLLRQALIAQKNLELKQTQKQTTANIAEAATANVAASANAAEAVAGATASGAKLPFPYNLAAIAAGLAEVLAALSQMGKFANGGIVGGGSYTGDKQTARVNSGEMILNRQQQRTLFDIANGKTKGSGGQVDFKIKGADLVGVINNYYSRMKG